MPTQITAEAAATHKAWLALEPEDRAVLAAAGAGTLTSDSRFVGTKHELRYPSGPDDQVQSARVPMRQHRRLRDRLGLITTSAQVEERPPTRPGQNCGHQITTMVLTPTGLAVLAALNASPGYRSQAAPLPTRPEVTGEAIADTDGLPDPAGMPNYSAAGDPWAITPPQRYSIGDTSPEARAERDVPRNPRPLCRDFTAQPPPAAFWCATCRWNEPMHADEDRRTAIAAELARWQETQQ